MNDPNLNPDEQQKKTKLRKYTLLALGLFIAGCALKFGTVPFETSSLQSILLTVAGSFCWIAAIILFTVQLRRQGKEGIVKSQFQQQDLKQRGLLRGMNMNEGTNKPILSPEQQELKRKAQKILLPGGLLFIGGLGLWVLSFSLDVSRIVSVLMTTIGGLCWGIAVALSIPVYFLLIRMQQGKGAPSEEQALKNKTTTKRLQIAAIVLFTALMLVASLFIFL
ncbi:MAG: hypothetical protein WC455_03445 [Dehalococcoidia bacterium]